MVKLNFDNGGKIDDELILAGIPNPISIYIYGGAGKINIPSDITIVITQSAIRPHQFENCTGATFIFQNKRINYFQEYCFAHCKKLNDDSLKDVKFGDSTELYEGALMDTGITQFVFPSTTYGYYNDWCLAFCEDLKTVQFIGEAYIPAYCFYGSGIEKLVFNYQTTIEEYAFSHCPNLASIEIYANNFWVGEYAFSDNPSLSFLGYYSYSYPNFEQNSLANCPKLTSVEVGDKYTFDDFMGLPLSNKKGSSNGGLIAGVVIAVVVVVGIAGFCVYYFYYKKRTCPFLNKNKENAEVNEFENIDGNSKNIDDSAAIPEKNDEYVTDI